jgi:hypothetical protein
MILALPVLSHSMLMLSEEELACAADSGRGNALAAFRSRKFNQLISASGFGPSFGCLTLEWNQKPCSGIGVTKKRPSPDDRSEAEPPRQQTFGCPPIWHDIRK